MSSRVVALAIALSMGSSLAPAAYSQTFVTFDVPGRPVALNAKGEVTGHYEDEDRVGHAYLRKKDGTIISFDAETLPEGIEHTPGTFPASINDAGVIVGTLVDLGLNRHGFLRTSNGNITLFDVPGARGTNLFTITSSGGIIGLYGDTNGVPHTFLRKTNGTIVLLDLPGSQFFSANAINPAGEITGTYVDADGVYHGFLREKDGTFTSFNVTSSGNLLTTFASAINGSGTIVGTYEDTGSIVSHCFIRKKDGSIVTFDPSPGVVVIVIAGIDSAGEVAGYSLNSALIASNAFLRKKDGTILSIDVPGSTSTIVTAIDPGGLILGSYSTGDGGGHAFLSKE